MASPLAPAPDESVGGHRGVELADAAAKETVEPLTSGHSAHARGPERIPARAPVDDFHGHVHVRFPIRVRLKRTGNRKRTTMEGQGGRQLL